MVNKLFKPLTASPCNGQCFLSKTEICTGCGRSIHEIAGWSLAGSKEREAVVEAARLRLRSLAAQVADGSTVATVSFNPEVFNMTTS